MGGIYLKNNNLLNKNVVILTTEEKKFFYENLFNVEVINNDNINILYDNKNTLHLYLITTIKNYYKYYEICNKIFRDPVYHNGIKNFKLHKYYSEKKYIVIHNRPNNKKNIILYMIDKILKKYNYDIDIYIFSKFGFNYINHKNIIIFNDLKKYFSLINSNNCKLLITPISGLGEMSNLIGNCNVIIFHDSGKYHTYLYDQLIKYHNKNNFDENIKNDRFFHLIPLNNFYRYIFDISHTSNNIDNYDEFKFLDKDIEDILEFRL